MATVWKNRHFHTDNALETTRIAMRQRKSVFGVCSPMLSHSMEKLQVMKRPEAQKCALRMFNGGESAPDWGVTIPWESEFSEVPYPKSDASILTLTTTCMDNHW